ncbi:tRNA pseudouridine(13) synthase TruD [Kangiella sediminilitoris]|uniref:tRNA pseudouridine synthase D n=1 Tax=Kangiella sediminilitoris TaxID=1144748 RepID=A0A1B3BBQ6_9GAMM|nr:tRNA pseudouridine(13) synthase TruD [Kangiella sediminilitoris]AOE50226.1 tRNA pseudouridine synthase D [Kangiella sediminilitoris]
MNDYKQVACYDWHRFYGKPLGEALFKSLLEDFVVEESLRFEPSGEGAHHYLYIEKHNVNTDIVCHKLRRFADVKPTDIGYAGKKDRFAVARQWFSVQLPLLQETSWPEFNDDEVTVLEAVRHDKKLRIGAVKSNHFNITLREFKGKKDEFEQRLQQVAEYGFPNYFGEQRFGNQGSSQLSNLERGIDLLMSNKKLKNRNLQGLLYSSVRSFLFNHVLSKRIEKGLHSTLLEGDYVQLSGSEKGFIVKELDAEQPRFKEHDILLTGPLPGSRSQPLHEAKAFETEALADYQVLIEKLANKRFNEDRRALVCFPKNVTSKWHNDETVTLSFDLPKGCFATSLLRELVVTNQMNTKTE